MIFLAYTGALAEFNLRRSPFSHVIERNVEKIDDFFAYVGGLISSILAGIGLLDRKSVV